MKSIKIGRGHNNDAIINDAVVSSSHAIITVSDIGEVYIEDLSSKNGTYVNGSKISEKTKLSSSSVVLLGNHSIDWKEIIRTYKPKVDKPQVYFPTDIVDKKLIGRNPSSQVRFSFDDVSDKHAYLCKKSDGSIVIIDNQSTNGTFVNGEKIVVPRELKKGDTVVLSNRHPFNWEAIYSPKPKFEYKYLAIALATAAIIVLVCIFKPWDTLIGKSWTKIYAEHKNDVVLVYVKSAFVSKVQGHLLSAYLNGYDELDYCSVSEEGKVSSGISRGSGTGFFISNDGKFLTNRHVVGSKFEEEENCKIVKRAVQSVLVENGLNSLAANVDVEYEILSIGIVQNDTYIDNESNLIPCTLIRLSDNAELDVALLQTNNKMIPTGSSFVDLSKSLPSEKLTIGTEICTIGFPQSFIIGQTSVGLEANNQSGEITQERGSYQYGHNITIHQGASGSPVYDKKGRFSGIIVSGFLGISQGYNHAIQPKPVIDFVEN